MKELSIAEKAKAYDEALALMQDCIPDENGLVHVVPEEIFPELKESEDERIRKWLICTLKSLNNSPVQIDGAYEMMLPAIAWLEKQGEQKPADKVEPKFHKGDIIRHKKQGFTCKIIDVDTEYRLSGCNGTHLPFDAQDAYELVVQKPAWSEEDDKNLEKTIWYVEKGAKLIFKKSDKLVSWLKHLKERILPQPKQEWSKEDERTYKSITYSFAHNYPLTVQQQEFVKSIKERYSWKPSDEQIITLEYYMHTLTCNEHKEVLFGLYTDLKKLKG